MSQHSHVLVFLGPTLPVDRARDVLDADYRPPAGQGDIYAVAEEGRHSTIALVDGVFQTEPSVRHKEILWALHKGIRVFGAGSMGALRAAELAPFGMIGVGSIYRWYRRFQMTPDDAVAVAQAPPELDNKPLSVALVDLVMTFRAARRAGAIERRLERRLARAAVAVHYMHRTLDAVISSAGKVPGDEKQPGLATILGRFLRQQKQEDALLLLSHLANAPSASRPLEVDRKHPFAVTDSWYQDLMLAGQSPPPPADW